MISKNTVYFVLVFFVVFLGACYLSKQIDKSSKTTSHSSNSVLANIKPLERIPQRADLTRFDRSNDEVSFGPPIENVYNFVRFLEDPLTGKVGKNIYYYNFDKVNSETEANIVAGNQDIHVRFHNEGIEIYVITTLKSGSMTELTLADSNFDGMVDSAKYKVPGPNALVQENLSKEQADAKYSDILRILLHKLEIPWTDAYG